MEQSIEQILAELKAAGVLDHLSPAEVAAAEKHASDLDVASPTLLLDILRTIPQTVYCPDGGSQNRELQNPALYPDIFGHLEAISHGLLGLDLSEVTPHSWGLLYAVNQTLAHLERAERFYWIEYPDDGLQGPLRGWGLIYLSDAQYWQLTQQKALRLKASYEWGTIRLNHTVAILQDLGLLSEFSQAEIEETRQKILLTDIAERSLAGMLDAFGLIDWIDAEGIYDVQQDYRKLVEAADRLSRGVFTPDSIQISEPNPDQHFTLSFEYEGGTFARQIEQSGDWINWDYLMLINQALASAGRDHRFCLLETDDQTAPILFLSGDQLRKVLDNNLLPLVNWVAHDV